MTSKYELWHADDLGSRLAYINDVISFEYVKVLGDIGFCALYVPKRGQIYDSTVPDRRIAIYRQPIDGHLSLDYIGLARQFEIITSAQGQYQLGINGSDLNELLQRRIAAYYAGEAETSVSGTADDLMKEAVRDQLIDNADYSGTPDPARDIDSYGFSVQADTSDGPTINKGFAWRNLLTVLQDMQADSKAQGTEVFFGIVPVTETTMEFRTWTAGRDRTVASGTNPIVFSLEWGNLANPRLVYDYSTEENYVYAGGKGEEVERIIQTASDTDRIDVSRLNRREGFAYSNGGTTATVLTDARDRLERKRPSTRLYGDLLDTQLTPYGGIQGWQVGDKVTANYAGKQFDVTIRSVHVKVDATGKETIKAKIES